MDVLAQVTASVLRALTRVWVRLFGSVNALPLPDGPDGAQTSPDAGERVPSEPGIDFPQVWTDAVDDGLTEIVDAMDRAANSVHREVESAPVARPLAYRTERLRSALAPSRVAKEGFRSVQLGMMQPTLLKSEVAGAVSDVLVLSHTQQQIDEARRRGPEWGVIWIPERDACVRCLAYAGLHVKPGEEFPGGLTYGPPWPSVTEQEPFIGPGSRMHPRCRCELHVIRLTEAPDTAAALQREARRSIAKGWSRESEGESVRSRAAKRLLADGAALPQSVVDEARRRLRSGKPFRRAVP